MVIRIFFLGMMLLIGESHHNNFLTNFKFSPLSSIKYQFEIGNGEITDRKINSGFG
jgi:hypothetical protein